MKKIEYVTPEMEVLEIEISGMLCVSDGTTSTATLDNEYSDGEDPE